MNTTPGRAGISGLRRSRDYPGTTERAAPVLQRPARGEGAETPPFNFHRTDCGAAHASRSICHLVDHSRRNSPRGQFGGGSGRSRHFASNLARRLRVSSHLLRLAGRCPPLLLLAIPILCYAVPPSRQERFASANPETVWVETGVQHLRLERSDDRALVVLGRADRSSCVVEVTDYKSVIENTSSACGLLTVRNVTFRKTVRDRGASAIAWGTAYTQPEGNGVLIEDCWFEGFSDSYGCPTSCGSTVFARRVQSLTIRRCEFVANTTDRGGVISAGAVPSVVIDECRFENGGLEPGGGAVIRIEQGYEALIQDCELRAEEVHSEGNFGLWVESDNLRVIRVQAYDAGTSHTAVSNWYLWPNFHNPLSQVFELRECVIASASGLAGSGEGNLEVASSAQSFQMVGNTFVGVFVAAGADGAQPGSAFERNVVAFGETIIDGRHWDVICNLFWPEPQRIRLRKGVERDNVVADPMFCGAEEWDFRVRDDSPCVNDSLGCGQIGLFGVGCSSTAVSRLSWGRLKARYAR